MRTEPAQAKHMQTESSPAGPTSAIVRSFPLWQAGVLAALSIWLYWSTLIRLVNQWRTDENFSHGFFVPLFSAFVIWQERHRLARILPQPSWSGLVALVGGLGVLIIGRMGAELFLDRSS